MSAASVQCVRRAGFAAIAMLALALAWIAQDARDVALPDGRDAPIQCLSYAPYRLAGETPFDPEARVTRERVREDLTRLATRTNCVRT